MQSFWPSEYAALDFDLPEALIATQPAVPADAARLMVINRQDASIQHDTFANLGNYLHEGDAIFYNSTQVEARRVRLKRADRETEFECVFLKTSRPYPPRPFSPSLGQGGEEKSYSLPPDLGEGSGLGANGRKAVVWQVLMRNIRRLKDGAGLIAVRDPSYTFTISRRDDQILLTGQRQLRAADFARIGEMPLPPYMRRPAMAADNTDYQNFFSRQMDEAGKILGSAASPTAALHFTKALYDSLRHQAVNFLPLCLDIGYGTFAPLSEKNFTTGKLHAEHYYIPPESARAFSAETAQRKIALGTTALRALVSYARSAVTEGETELFVHGHQKIDGIQGLITNFHLPRSSLLLLVAAFCGQDLLARAYGEALEQQYRFYSYGDAMLIL